jgi:hypothetical protein
MPTFIYLVENCYGNPNTVYIGKTKNSRKKDHKRKYGSDIIYTIIDQVDSLNQYDWEPLETFWINYFKFLGFKLMNIRQKGGNGVEFCSNKHKNKISKALKGRKNTWHNNKKGHKRTEEQKQKLRKPRPPFTKSKKLNNKQINEVITKFKLDHTRSDLYREYNVSWGTINNIIKSGENYKI